MAAIIKNPVFWVLLVLLGLVEFNNYLHSRELSRVCELLGPHTISYSKSPTAHEEIDTICVNG